MLEAKSGAGIEVTFDKYRVERNKMYGSGGGWRGAQERDEQSAQCS